MACLFCEIVAGRIPSKKAFEDDELYAFHDIAPQAPTHILVVPKRHITSPNDLAAGDDALIGRMVRTAKELAREAGLAERGYRLNFNCGPDAGYSVFHVHLHLLGGRSFHWPPG
ncbi:MAG: histidine triad nucleotide-binding protein [Vicinamibacteria bacterium]|nr:histidine triad nucleotide-binding protein [Vicinamibacteria bacterium]